MSAVADPPQALVDVAAQTVDLAVSKMLLGVRTMDPNTISDSTDNVSPHDVDKPAPPRGKSRNLVTLHYRTDLSFSF